MPWIRFAKPSRQDFEVEQGSNLMQSLLAKNIPVASSCKGDGICAKCKIRVLESPENLTPVQEREAILRERNSLKKEERISCQVCVLGDVKVDMGYW